MKEVHRMETDDLRTQVDEQARLIDQQQLQLRTLQRTIQRLDDRSSLQPRKREWPFPDLGCSRPGSHRGGNSRVNHSRSRVSAAAGGAVGQTLSFLKSPAGSSKRHRSGRSSQSANFKIAVFDAARVASAWRARENRRQRDEQRLSESSIQAVNTAEATECSAKVRQRCSRPILRWERRPWDRNGGTAVAGEDSGSGPGLRLQQGVGVQA